EASGPDELRGGTRTMELSPTQQRAYDGALRALSIGDVVVLWGGTGMGKTTVLREIHRTRGGAFLTMKPFIDAMRDRHPLAMEETFEQMMMTALAAHDIVILDDLHLLARVLCCGAFYPRQNFLEAPLTALMASIAEMGKKVVFGSG